MVSLIDVVNSIKEAADASNFINEVKLIKSEEDMKNIFRDTNFRALFIIITDADILTQDDYYGISLTVMDKAGSLDDDSYVYSLMDGVSALREISDRLNYDTGINADVQYKTMKFTSGIDSGNLITVIDADIEYALDPVPNIHIDA